MVQETALQSSIWFATMPLSNKPKNILLSLALYTNIFCIYCSAIMQIIIQTPLEWTWKCAWLPVVANQERSSYDANHNTKSSRYSIDIQMRNITSSDKSPLWVGPWIILPTIRLQSLLLTNSTWMKPRLNSWLELPLIWRMENRALSPATTKLIRK